MKSSGLSGEPGLLRSPFQELLFVQYGLLRMDKAPGALRGRRHPGGQSRHLLLAWCLSGFTGSGSLHSGRIGAGKTTHTYGLLRSPKARVVSDDWFFARIFWEEILAYGSEKNFYIRADLADIGKEFSGLVDKAVFDEKGRAVVDLRWVIGKGRILPLTTMENVILLRRDPSQEETVRELNGREALAILEENGYFNPHLLVKSDFKSRLRSHFFQALFARAKVHEVNTRGTPEESQRAIREILGGG